MFYKLLFLTNIYSSNNYKSWHWFSKFNNKTGRHDTSHQRPKRHGKGITLYMPKTESLGIQLKCVHMYLCNTEVAKMSVLAMTTTSLDDGLTTTTRVSNQTLHNTLWNIYHLWYSAVRSCGSVWGGGFLMHPVDVLLGLHPANGRVNVTFWRWGTTGERAGQGNVWTLWRFRRTGGSR